jgi:hypothetical protein
MFRQNLPDPHAGGGQPNSLKSPLKLPVLTIEFPCYRSIKFPVIEKQGIKGQVIAIITPTATATAAVASPNVTVGNAINTPRWATR